MAEKIRKRESLRERHSKRKGIGLLLERGIGLPRLRGKLSGDHQGQRISKTRVHHLHFDTTDLEASVSFYTSILNFNLVEHKNGMAVIGFPRISALFLTRSTSLAKSRRRPIEAATSHLP